MRRPYSAHEKPLKSPEVTTKRPKIQIYHSQKNPIKVPIKKPKSNHKKAQKPNIPLSAFHR
jgi:hypothetical protein